MDPARWAAVGAGFAGVAAAACWGTGTVPVRWVGRTDSTLVQMLSADGNFAAGSLPPFVWLWRRPDALGLALTLGIGVVGGLGRFLLEEDFRHAPASALASDEHAGLVWAGVYGYAIWADITGPGNTAGAALIWPAA